MVNKRRMIFDLTILLVIIILIVYIKSQFSSEIFSPFNGMQAILGLN